MDMMEQRFRMIAAQPSQNLYTGGDMTWTNMYKLMFPLPVGIYRFSAAATSTDTDASVCCVRFMTGNDQSASTEGELDSYINRSSSGESHSFIAHCTQPVDHLYLYASSNWPKGKDDTVTFRNIRIVRIG